MRWLVFAGLAASAAQAETLIYEGTLEGVELGGDTQLEFSLCVEDVCSPALPADHRPGAAGAFSYAIRNVSPRDAASATHLLIVLRRGDEQPLELGRYEISSAIFSPDAAGEQFAPPLIFVTPQADVDPGCDGEWRCPSLAEAWGALQSLTIPPGGTTIQVSSGRHLVEEPLLLAHPGGQRIRIVGEERGAVFLDVVDGAGLIVPSGYQLGELRSLNLDGGEVARAGLDVQGGRATVGPFVTFSGFNVGISISDRGALTTRYDNVMPEEGDPATTITNTASLCIQVSEGAWLSMASASLSSCGQGGVTINNARARLSGVQIDGYDGSYGLLAEEGAVVAVRRIEVTGPAVRVDARDACIAAVRNSTINAQDADLDDCPNYGISAREAAFVWALNAEIESGNDPFSAPNGTIAP